MGGPGGWFVVWPTISLSGIEPGTPSFPSTAKLRIAPPDAWWRSSQS
jgi:hypothetical protein